MKKKLRTTKMNAENNIGVKNVFFLSGTSKNAKGFRFVCFAVLCLMFLGASQEMHAQSYNPFVIQATVTPDPIYDVASNGTGQISCIVGNSGDDDLTLVTNQEMLIVITLSRGEPNNANPISAVGGTLSSYFDWYYDAPSTSYMGVQNQTIPSALNGGVGTITVDYKVTSNSVSTSPQNGFNINITPPAYTNGINTLNDDFGSSYTWTISKINANPDFGVVPAGSTLTGNLSTNDIIISGSAYGNPVANASNPASCMPVVASNGTYSFTCATPGEYNFTVTVCEPGTISECFDVPLQITVTDLPSATAGPIANPDYTTVLKDNPVIIQATANDVCMNGPTCSLSNPTIITGPASAGSTAVVNPNGTITFTPATGFTGKDSILYAVCDNQTPVAKCDTEWIYINVLQTGNPNTTNADDDFAVTPYGTALNGNVTANDTDPESNTQTVTAQTTTLAGKGTLTLTTSGTYTFTPVSGFSGSADFAYTTCDNGTPQACASATIHILVQPNLFQPVLNPDFGVTQPGTPLTGNLNTNDTPVTGSTYSDPPANPSNPGTCAPVVASNGTYTFTCTTPGEYNFMVPVCEPSPSTVCTNVPLQITVTSPVSLTAGPIANPDFTTTLAATPVTVNVKSNDVCMNGASCSLGNPTIVSGPSGAGSTALVALNGTIIFTPDPGFVGKDSIQYQVCDNQTPLAKCDTEWVYITVLPVGNPNTTNAGDDFITTSNGVSVSGNVLVNDTDPEGHTRTVTAQSTTVAGKGALVLASNGDYTFIPEPTFTGGAVDFAYTVCDNGTPQACASATLHILVGKMPPDLTPNITMTPNVIHGVTSFNVTVKVTELNNVSTNGTILVRVPKDSRVTFTYNPSATSFGFVNVENSTWTYVSTNPFFHIFTRSASISAGSFSTFGFLATFNPTSTDGKYSMTSTISNGGGGEVKFINNTDSESADYFHY